MTELKAKVTSFDLLKEIRKAIEAEEDFQPKVREEDRSAYTYAYKQGFKQALQFVRQDIDLIEKAYRRNVPLILISANEMAELINTNMKVREKDYAGDPDTPGYLIACEEMLAFMSDLDTYE